MEQMGSKRVLSKACVVCLGFACLGGAAATTLPDVFDASTGFDVQTKKVGWDVAGTFANCGANPSVENTFWSSGLSIHAGTNYYAGFDSYVYPNTVTIPGGTSELFVQGPVAIELRKNLKCDRRFVVQPGARILFANLAKETWVSGEGSQFQTAILDVLGDKENPFIFAARYNHGNNDKAGNWLKIDCLVGDETAFIYTPYALAYSATQDSRWWFEGDASAYKGTWLVDGARVDPGVLHLALDTSHFAGTVVLTNEAQLTKLHASEPRIGAVDVSHDSTIVQDGKAFSFGKMTFAEGSRILFTATKPGLISVTDAFVHDGPVTLDFNNQKVFDWTVAKSFAGAPAGTNELIRFAAGIAVSEDDFRVVNVARALAGHLPVPYLAVRPNDDGSSSLLLTHKPVVVPHRSLSMVDDEAIAWCNGVVSSPDTDYLLPWISATQSSTGKSMETAMYIQIRNEGVNDFGGASLTLASGNVWLYGRHASIAELVLYKGGFFVEGADSVFTGRIRVTSTGGNNDSSRIEAKSNASLVLKADLVGEASRSLNLRGPGPLILAGNNAGYQGRLVLALDGTTVTVCDADSLGGGNTSFMYNAIDLSVATCCVRATNDVCLSHANRGFFVRQPAAVDVAEACELAVAAPFTFASRLTKRGPGVLAFRAKPRFGDGAAETEPSEGQNVLQVAEGGIKVDAAEALNGLAVTFAANTALHLSAAPVDSALAASGAIMTRTGSSFACDGGNVRLVIDGYDADAKTVVCPVATFATRAVAEAALASMDPGRLASGLVGALSLVASDGGYTVCASYTHPGLTVVIR